MERDSIPYDFLSIVALLLHQLAAVVENKPAYNGAS